MNIFKISINFEILVGVAENSSLPQSFKLKALKVGPPSLHYFYYTEMAEKHCIKSEDNKLNISESSRPRAHTDLEAWAVLRK